MKTLRHFIPVIISLLLLGSMQLKAQRGHGHPHRGHRPGGRVVVVKRSPFRPNKVIVYHPIWGPRYAIQRRWVYFPKYNLYWDNWRSMYVFMNSGIWVAKASPPPVVVNVNLENEKHYELKEGEDDNDDVYKSNDAHKKDYKSE